MKRYLILMFLLLCIPVFAQRKLTTNEATILAVGPFFDSTDGITPETGITVTGLTVEIYRELDDGSICTRFANFVPTASGGANDMALITSSVSGMYSLEVTAAQLNFTGSAIVTIVDTDSAGIVGLPLWRPFTLTSANVVDAEYGTDKLQVDATEVEGGDATDALNAATPDLSAITGDKASYKATGFAVSGEPATALSDANLDHLVKIAVDTSLPTTVHDNSVFGYLLAKANVVNYNRTEDSGEGRTDYGDSSWLTAVNTNLTTIEGTDATDYIEGRTLAAAAYFLFGTDEVTTDAASRTASQADVSGLATSAALNTHDGKLDTVDGIVDAVKVVTDILAGLYEDVTGYRFTTKALEQAPSGSGATAEEVRIEMDSNSTQLAAIVEDTGTTIPGLISAIGGGDGSVVVDHDTGGADALAYKTAGGVGIDNAVIRAYLKSDYDAGNTGSAYIKATTTTDVNGRWTNQMNLDPATYTLYYFKQGSYGPDTQEVAVE